VIACVQLAGSLNQWARGAAIGAATICGEPEDLHIETIAVPVYPMPFHREARRRWHGEPEILAPGNGKLRLDPPTVPPETEGVALASSSFTLGLGRHYVASAFVLPTLQPALSIQDTTAPQRFTDNAASDEPSESGLHMAKSRQLNDAYVFFDEEGNMVEQAKCPDMTAQSCQGSDTTISGSSAADVSGDDVDLTLKNYELNPDLLQSRGGLTFSAGFSSVEGASIGGKIARKKIGGFERELAASVRLSQMRQMVEIGYVDGNLLGSSMAAAPTLFAHRMSAKGFGSGLRSLPFNQGSYGTLIQLSRKFDNTLSLNATYRLSSDTIRMRRKNMVCDAQLYGSPLCNSLGSRTNSLLSVSLVFDKRRHEGDFYKGVRLRLAQDTGVGGSAPFSRTRVGAEAHLGLGEYLSFHIDLEGGYVAKLAQREVPLFERFYAGDASLRGFDLRGVGPKVLPTGTTGLQNVALGGKAYYVGRAELSANVGGFFKRIGLQPSLFVDAGSVFKADRSQVQPGEQLIGNSSRPRVSVGMGLAWRSPAGTVRFDLAKPVAKQAGDRTRAFAISFSAAV
jgi:hypothetical protein